MSMEINGNVNYYKTDYAEQLRTQQQEKAEEVKSDTKEVPIPKDEYIHSEESDRKPSGLYRLGQDENGNPKVLYDDPKKPASVDKSGSPKKAEEKCTCNTDWVDKEIEKLKEEKKQLEQQIKSVSGDERKVQELKKQLAQIENELSQKDNDTYRQQHAYVQMQ